GGCAGGGFRAGVGCQEREAGTPRPHRQSRVAVPSADAVAGSAAGRGMAGPSRRPAHPCARPPARRRSGDGRGGRRLRGRERRPPDASGAMNALDLTPELRPLHTINPPGEEEACIRHLARVLEAAGFTIEEHAFAPRRTSLVARLGTGGTAPICFTGHIDTVPLGAVPWTRDAFAGETSSGRLY